MVSLLYFLKIAFAGECPAKLFYPFLNLISGASCIDSSYLQYVTILVPLGTLLLRANIHGHDGA
jgi:hypothetical protein